MKKNLDKAISKHGFSIEESLNSWPDLNITIGAYNEEKIALEVAEKLGGGVSIPCGDCDECKKGDK